MRGQPTVPDATSNASDLFNIIGFNIKRIFLTKIIKTDKLSYAENIGN
jgi:hypothetical protein